MHSTLLTAIIFSLSLTLQLTSAAITNGEFSLGKALDASNGLLNNFNGDQDVSIPHVPLAKRCSNKLHVSRKDINHTKRKESHSSDKKKDYDKNKSTSKNIKKTKKKGVSKSNTHPTPSHPKFSHPIISKNVSSDYSLEESYRGKNFWSQSNWDFWTDPDPTHGQVNYQSEQNAKEQGLIGLKGSKAFVRMSNEDIVDTNRSSVRFQSKRAFDSGLVIFDVVKMPVGCATWPAIWTTDNRSWPQNGEIDVLEGIGYTVEGKNVNQFTVHIGEDSPLQLNRRSLESRASFLGRIREGATNCYQWGAHTGCAIYDSNKNGPSWGTEFNNAGGGIWAMQFGNNGGVKIWFWGRKSGKIPKELSKPTRSPKKLNPSSWGKPMADFQSEVVDAKVKNQNIIINITVGGDWAGSVPLDGKCTGQDIKQAIKKGSNYDDAEFIINGVDVYCKNGKC